MSDPQSPTDPTPRGRPAGRPTRPAAACRIGGASFSPDAGTLLFHSNSTDVFIVRGSSRRRTAVQLTHSTGDAIFSLGYVPQDERIVYWYRAMLDVLDTHLAGETRRSSRCER